MPSLAPTTSAVSPVIPKFMIQRWPEAHPTKGKEVSEGNLGFPLRRNRAAAASEARKDSLPRSVDLRAGQLDHLLVLVVIRFEAARELLRRHDEWIQCLALQRRNHVRHPKHLVHVCIELVDDRFRSATRREHADPRGEFVAGYP